MSIQFLSLQGTGGTAVPYERRNAPYYVSSVAVNPQDSLRLKRYEEHWRFYSGIQWSFQREDGEPLVTANYCRPVVNKKASFLLGKGVLFDTPEALREITLPIIDEVWEYNNKETMLLEMAITGGVTGDVFVMPVFQPPTQKELAINPYTEGKIRLRLCLPHQVFPTWNPLNHEELQHVRIVTEVADQPQWAPEQLRNPITVGNLGAQRKRRYVEDIFPDRIIEGWEDEGRNERPNDLGEVPMVHIANETFPGEYFGFSDLDGVIDIQREYNEKLTDISDIVNYHAAPVTVVLGAKVRNLDKGPKSIWGGLPADAKVFNLELGGSLDVSHKYLTTIQQILFDISGIPEGSLGRLQNISNTSAAALQVQFQPLIEATDRKKPTYKAGLQKINYFILRWWQIAKRVSFPVDLCEHCGGRIVEKKDEKGLITRRCYMVHPQTMEFMKPDDVQITFKRQLSFGTETRKMTFRQVKEEFLKKSASFWDPQEETDLEEEAEEDRERQQKVQEFQHGEQDRVQKEQAESDKANEPPETDEEGNPVEKSPAVPPATPVKPLPPELQKEPEIKPPQLADYDVDIPEEPEKVDVTVRVWNAANGTYEEQKLGVIEIVPTGCDKPRYLNPYKTLITFRSALPRDRERDANLYAMYQTNGWTSRRWAQEHLDEEIKPEEVNKQLADDIPFINALKGVPNQTGQVAQTSGAPEDQTGSNNGAPLPPGPGPGRGNKYAPGDNAAGKAPPSAAPGTAGGVA